MVKRTILIGVHTYDIIPITSKEDPGILVKFDNSNGESFELVLSSATHTGTKTYDWNTRLGTLINNAPHYQIVWTDDTVVKSIQKTVNKKTVLLFDMDGVLCDFEESAIQVLNSNGSFQEDFDSAEWSQMISDCQDIPGFYRNLKPIEGGCEAFVRLSQYYDCYICSAPSATNPSSWTDKHLWVNEFIGDAGYKRLILTHNKGMFEGRALIDDRIKYGVKEFKGEHIQFGHGIFKDWKTVERYLTPDTLFGVQFNQHDFRLGKEKILASETTILARLIHSDVSIEDLTIHMWSRHTPYYEAQTIKMLRGLNDILKQHKITLWITESVSSEMVGLRQILK